MTDSLQISQNTITKRIESIDVLRGITILAMLFVNDVAGVTDVPGWMKHMAPTADGMTFVDVVFPAFLFIVGMAIPFAIGNRLEKGESMFKVWKHILIRTIGLLIIGMFMVNSGSLSKSAAISQQIWTLLMYSGVILVWNVLPGISKSKKNLYMSIKSFGILLLLLAVLLFKGNNMTGIIHTKMVGYSRSYWLGIFCCMHILYSNEKTSSGNDGCFGFALLRLYGRWLRIFFRIYFYFQLGEYR
jgi:predicted acyltransferase